MSFELRYKPPAWSLTWATTGAYTTAQQGGRRRDLVYWEEGYSTTRIYRDREKQEKSEGGRKEEEQHEARIFCVS